MKKDLIFATVLSCSAPEWINLHVAALLGRELPDTWQTFTAYQPVHNCYPDKPINFSYGSNTSYRGF